MLADDVCTFFEKHVFQVHIAPRFTLAVHVLQ